MLCSNQLAVGIILALILLAGCSRAPQAPTGAGLSTDSTGSLISSIADPCMIVLTPHQGRTAVDQDIIRFQQASRQASESGPYLERLGWAYIAKARAHFDPGFYTLAEQCALCMELKQSESAQALLLRGHVLHNLHRFQEGEILARRLVAERGRSFDYGLLGDLLMEQGKITEATEAYGQMMKEKPSPQAYIRAANVRWITGDLDGAIQVMKIAAGGFRDSEAAAWAQVRLALYHLQAGQDQLASSRVEVASAMQADYAPALFVRGRMLLAEGKNQDAIAPLTRAAQLNPLPEYQWFLIEALEAAGQRDDARGVEEELRQGGMVNDRRTFALYLATTGQAPETAVRLAQAELKVRADVFTLDALAWALSAAGRHQEARAVSTQAMTVGTPDARLFYHAGVIAASVGQHEEATSWFTKAATGQQTLLPSERNQLLRAAAALSSQRPTLAAR